MLSGGVVRRSRVLLSLVLMLGDSILACRGRCALASPVWQNPCGLSEKARRRSHYHMDNEISPDGLRHPSARPLRRVRTQLRITYNHFRDPHLQRDIAIVYSGVKNLLKEEFEYDWLPAHQLTWYRENVKCLDKKTKIKILLPGLHSALQNFSATFEELRMYGGESHLSEHQDLFSTRRRLFSEISQQVKKLLCEVETAIMNVGLQLPDRLSAEAGATMIWDMHPDHTGGLIQDWGVLAAYQTFLDDWLKIVRRVVGNKSNVPCKPKVRHKKKPVRKKLKPER